MCNPDAEFRILGPTKLHIAVTVDFLEFYQLRKPRIPERIIIQKPKRMKVSENISNTLSRILAAKAVADTAKTKIKMPSERTPTGLLGIKPHSFMFLGWL